MGFNSGFKGLTVKKAADNFVFSLWAKIFSLIDPRPDRPRDPPNLIYSGYHVVFLWVKRPDSGIDHPQPSSAEVKERVELYPYSPSGPSWYVTV